MERLLYTRVENLPLVLKGACKSRAREIGIPYAAMRYLSEERVNALSATNLSEGAQIAEGVACIAAFKNPEIIEAQLPVPTEDPERVYKNLHKLVRFMLKQVEGVEERIIINLNQIGEAVEQFENLLLQYESGQNGAQPAQFQFHNDAHQYEDFHLMQVPDFDDVRDEGYEGLDFPIPMQIDDIPDISSMHPVVEQLSNIQELFSRDIINRWKSFQIYEERWVWPDCPKIYEWLSKMVRLALRLYKMYTKAGENEEAIDRVLKNIFNDCFLVRIHPSRFFVYKPDSNEKKGVRGHNVEFQHLLSEFFTPKTRPILTVVDEDHMPSVFSRPRGSFSCEQKNIQNLGTITYEGTTLLRAKFPNLKIGNPRPREREAPEGDQKQKCGSSTTKKTAVSQTKYWLVCEMDIDVGGWRCLKVTSHTLVVIIGANTCQSPQSWVTIRYEDAGCSRRRGHFVARPALCREKILKSLNRLIIAKLGQPFSEINLQCLREALQSIAPDGMSLEQLNTSRINDMGIPGITFYDFTYGQIDLACNFEDFKELWRNGLVMGWIKRDLMHMLLQNRQIGTLLIRVAFSKRAVVLTWKHAGGVASLEPFTENDLKVKSLVQRIEEIKSQIELSYIYPNYSPEVLFSPNEAPPSPPPSPPLDEELPAHIYPGRSYVKAIPSVTLVYPTNPLAEP